MSVAGAPKNLAELEMTAKAVTKKIEKLVTGLESTLEEFRVTGENSADRRKAVDALVRKIRSKQGKSGKEWREVEAVVRHQAEQAVAAERTIAKQKLDQRMQVAARLFLQLRQLLFQIDMVVSP